ncbi:deoxynucleoside kinase [Ruminococcus gauvreauii]|uniref:deoxynucleoside kinase n=1 Tax=Ruminococcus gauvreauii TaxID=438033 RepID=UPI0039842B61
MHSASDITSKQPYRLEICGGIASGKTTLAHILDSNGLPAVYERYWENPFLGEFYTTSEQTCAFETEVVFTLQHYYGIRNSVLSCFDYSIVQDLAYADVNLPADQRRIYHTLYQSLLKRIRYPAYLIYLKCDAGTAQQRLLQRGRKSEANLSQSYLQRIISALENQVFKQPNVLVLDSQKLNFLTQEQMVLNVVKEYFPYHHWS